MSHLQDSQKKHRQRLRPIFGVTTIKATSGCECQGCHYFSGCETQGLFQDFPVPFQANLGRITELGFNFLNKIIVFFVESQVQKSIFGLFNQCLYSYQNKGARGARVQNHSTVTRGYLNNFQKAILLGLG